MIVRIPQLPPQILNENCLVRVPSTEEREQLMPREILNSYLIIREEPGWETKLSLQDAFNHNMLTTNEIEEWKSSLKKEI